MSISYVKTYEAQSSGAVQEHKYRFINLDNGTGIEVLFHYPAYITQIYASWANTTEMTLSVQLPSGVSYTFATYGTGTAVDSLTLNHLDTGSNDFIYWMKLPVGARLRFGVDSGESAPGDFEVSIIATPC